MFLLYSQKNNISQQMLILGKVGGCSLFFLQEYEKTLKAVMKHRPKLCPSASYSINPLIV